MPCCCWFEPPESSKRLVKFHCEEIIRELKRLDREGDPLGLQLHNVKELLDHLWNPESCKEKNE
jgi:hypothetical protein